jgi:Glycosyltransferase sugar-binding region containing DXD motif
VSIPKLIHLCWFGRGVKSPAVLRCERSAYALERFGYGVKVWDETNFNIDASPRTRDAYKAKRWSLVSNYVRLAVLAKHGGIYLDSDVQVIKSFDNLLHYGLFLGFMWDCNLGTAVIGSAPGHAVVQSLLRQYDERPETYVSPNNDTFTRYFLSHVPGFVLDGRAQHIADIYIGERHTFEQPSLFRRANYTVHHFEQSWKPKRPLKQLAKKAAIGAGSLWLYRKYVCWNAKRISPFYGDYAQATRRPRTFGRAKAHGTSR